MNIQSVSNQPVSDDNDLAKILSGADGQFPVAEPEAEAPAVVPEPEAPAAPIIEAEAVAAPAVHSNGHEGLEEIKKQALEELRPLIDKLDLPPEELFDIILLIIRSTDDEELIKKAHETAVKIEDESREAQALLDVIKEVDYFSNK